MLKQQPLLFWLDDEEAHALAVQHDMTCVFRRKAGEKALSGSNGVEPSDPLETLAHCFNPQRSQRCGVGRRCSSERDGRQPRLHEDGL
jgi:hypothetical protein